MQIAGIGQTILYLDGFAQDWQSATDTSSNGVVAVLIPLVAAVQAFEEDWLWPSLVLRQQDRLATFTVAVIDDGSFTQVASLPLQVDEFHPYVTDQIKLLPVAGRAFQFHDYSDGDQLPAGNLKNFDLDEIYQAPVGPFVGIAFAERDDWQFRDPEELPAGDLLASVDEYYQAPVATFTPVVFEDPTERDPEELVLLQLIGPPTEEHAAPVGPFVGIMLASDQVQTQRDQEELPATDLAGLPTEDHVAPVGPFTLLKQQAPAQLDVEELPAADLRGLPDELHQAPVGLFRTHVLVEYKFRDPEEIPARDLYGIPDELHLAPVAVFRPHVITPTILPDEAIIALPQLDVDPWVAGSSSPILIVPLRAWVVDGEDEIIARWVLRGNLIAAMVAAGALAGTPARTEALSGAMAPQNLTATVTR